MKQVAAQVADNSRERSSKLAAMLFTLLYIEQPAWQYLSPSRCMVAVA